jgi:CBS domain-containing protein
MGLLQLGQEAPAVSPETLVLDAVALMAKGRVGAIVVTSAEDIGRNVVGVFTERDLMRRVVNEGRDPARTRIGDVMTSPVHTVSDETSVAEAASLMRQHHIRHLVITNGRGALQGVVAQRYLLYALMGDLELKVNGLQTFIMADGPGG